MSDINGIQNRNNFSQNISSNSVSQSAQGGMINGVEVAPADIEDSLLEDSLEEMTFAKDNSKQTKLALRKQKNAESRLQELLKKMQVATMEKVNSKSKADDVLRNASRVGCTPEDIIKSLKGFGGHDAESYAILMDLASKESNPSRAELIKNAAALLYSDNESGIKAVLNAMDVSEDNYAGFSALDNAENYSDALLNFKDGFSMLQFISDKYGNNFEQGIDFINKALGADLEAAQASHEPAFLRSVSKGLEQARVLYSCYAHEEVLLDRLDKIHGLDVSGFDKTKFIEKLGSLLNASFISPESIRGLIDTIHTKDPAEEVVVCQELTNTIKNFSDILFGTTEVRERFNDACTVLIDEKIRLEDEWLESQQ